MKKTAAFTLIEILITTAIIMVISSLGLAAYNDFNNRQTLDGVASQIKNDLRQTRGWAMNGRKTDDCDGDLTGYRVNFNPTASTYSAYMVCTNNTILVNTFSYDEAVNLDYDGNFTFAVLNGAIGQAVSMNLSLGARQGELIISANGEIN